jgi:hypothetical protein
MMGTEPAVAPCLPEMRLHAITVDKRLERLADDRRRRAGDRPA